MTAPQNIILKRPNDQLNFMWEMGWCADEGRAAIHGKEATIIATNNCLAYWIDFEVVRACGFCKKEKCSDKNDLKMKRL